LVERESDVQLDETKAGVMTKAELVDEVARVVQLTKKQAETIVNIVFDSIVDSLRSGQKIELRGFGSFRLRNRKSRTGRNPKTGEKVEVPSKKIPYFKPGKELKELINNAEGELPSATDPGNLAASE
jgi:integration host factor subunit beta